LIAQLRDLHVTGSLAFIHRHIVRVQIQLWSTIANLYVNKLSRCGRLVRSTNCLSRYCQAIDFLVLKHLSTNDVDFTSCSIHAKLSVSPCQSISVDIVSQTAIALQNGCFLNVLRSSPVFDLIGPYYCNLSTA